MKRNPDRGFLEESSRCVQVAPSLLASDFSSLGAEIRRAQEAGADLFHLDVMDGHFVPNLTIGPAVMKAIRPHTDLAIEAHLMVTDPLFFAPRFAQAGADAVTFHVEAVENAPSVAEAIRKTGVSVGISLNPETDVSTLNPLRGMVDFALVMTVVPGFGGQSFMAEPLDKVRWIAMELKVPVGVDGGITPETAPLAAEAGADIFIAGSAVFGRPDIEGSIRAIRDAAQSRWWRKPWIST